MEEKKIYQEEENINIKEILYQYLRYWKWFVISVILCGLLGLLYLEITPKQYQSEGKILLSSGNDSSPLPGLKELTAITDISNSKIDDQIEILKSRRLMTKVADKLDLNVQYYQKEGITTQEVYNEDAFVFIKFVDEKSKFLINSSTNLEIVIKSKNQFSCTDLLSGKEIEGTFGKPLRFAFGEIIILYNPKAEIGDKTMVTISPIMDTVLRYISSIDVNTTTKNGSVVSIGLQSTLPENANKIIDLLVQQYGNDIIEDRNKVGNSTISFINDRLALISKDLGSTDEDMERYKSQKGITDVVTEGQIAVQQSAKIDEQLKQYSIQLSLIDYMEKFIKTNNKSLVPTNIGLTDPSITQNTQNYNQLVLERDNLLKSSTEENPMVKSLNQRIREFNNNLETSLRNYKTTTQIAIGNLRGQSNQMMGNISGLPSKERGFRDIARKQQTVEALYLLLLQKREETEIATASTPDVVKIVDKAYYLKQPISPKKNIVLLASVLLGLIIPFGVLYVKFLLDDKVKSRKDIESVVKNIPVTGYIPKTEESLIDIRSVNSSSAEAFRILRTNIGFFLPDAKELSKCIYITSTISGEGKTYIAVNLAFTLALTNKKVLVIEADIRKPKVREYLGISKNPKGITEYLSENISDISQAIISVNHPKTSHNAPVKIDILPSGSKAPNPSELFMGDRFKHIIDYGLQNYDYVIVDTAPVSVVTDTLLINKYADLLLYVVRVNHLHKDLLEIPNQLKEDRKFEDHKTAILINDVDIRHGYGYGSKHGYGYSEEKEESWYKKILEKVKR